MKGRAAIGEMFAGLCKGSKDGGLNGIQFRPESSAQVLGRRQWANGF